MPQDKLLEKVKKLRELTGVGFKDCKNAIDENKGDIEKSIESLRKKGIAKANKKMERVAADGLVCIHEDNNAYSIVEINTETDFVAKNDNFITFAEEISELAFSNFGKIDNILVSKMKNSKQVKENLVDLIAKIGEKITIRRSSFFESSNSFNFSYMHTVVKRSLGKLGVLLSIEAKNKSREGISKLGKELAMHIAASSPLALDKGDLNKDILNKEKEIIIEELKSSGKDDKIIEKISLGKLNKFISDNTLLNQEWIMEPKKKVKDILKEVGGKDEIKIKNFLRYKVGEGV